MGVVHQIDEGSRSASKRPDGDVSNGRTVLGRIAVILDAFDGGDPVIRLCDLSERTGLPKPTVHRLVEQMIALGWLERDLHGYRIGMRLFELGGLAAQRNRLGEIAYRHMYAVSTRTGLSVQLAVLDRTEVVYLERIVTGRFQLPTRIGGRQPAYCTALGKAMLAYDPDSTQAVLSAGMPRRTQNTICTPNHLQKALQQVHARGYATDHEETYEGLSCVAAPIRNSGRAIAAISVTGPITYTAWESATHAVQQAAVSIWNDRFGSKAS